MTKKVKSTKTWAIRLSRTEYLGGRDNANYIPFMENYYPTREALRVAWKGELSVFKQYPFKAERFRVTDYPLIGKRDYKAVR